jgi:hypothetical protein
MIITLVFKKNANFFSENWEKSQKIVIITSTPGIFWFSFNFSWLFCWATAATQGLLFHKVTQASWGANPGSFVFRLFSRRSKARTYLVLSALVAGPAAALALDVLLHLAARARVAAHGGGWVRIAKLELDLWNHVIKFKLNTGGLGVSVYAFGAEGRVFESPQKCVY